MNILNIVTIMSLSALQGAGARQSREAKQITDQIVRDLGLSQTPNVRKANISDDEYQRKFRIYDQSMRQTTAMRMLKAHFKEHMRKQEQPASPLSAGGSAANRQQHSTLSSAPRRRRHKRSTPAAENSSAAQQHNMIHFDMEDLWRQLPSSAANDGQLVLVAEAVLSVELEQLRENSNQQQLQACAKQIVQDEEGITLDCVPLDDDLMTSSEGKIKIELDITHAVQAWLMDQTSNKGILIAGSGLSDGTWGLAESTQNTADDDDTDTTSHPVRIRFSTLPLPAATHHPRHRVVKRDVFDREFLERFVQQQQAQETAAKSDCSVQRAGGKKCCRQHMKVNLQNFEGLNFILEPKEFDAYYCVGRCPARYLPRNDHTLLQSLIHIQSRHGGSGGGANNNNVPGSSLIKRPCCNPSEFESIDILYLDENDPTKLEVKHWKDIIVSECACA
eukprot:TRINITY_DN20187_c0_g1_i3.p1 TRINITY_DN20187_c0_g1~~TRINITY_DN20187_c0_g1_i3.p1  ORF type:complete len:447 (-),score=130.59 TRINITY_DN20187_c0_g1_i3:107-1447(-)